MTGLRRVAGAAAALGVAAIAVAAVTGVLLADRYRPSGAAPFGAQPASVRSTAGLHDWHVGASWVALAGVVVAVAAAVAASSGGGRGRRLLVGGGVVAVVALVATMLTGDLLAWDQLGLLAVAVGGPEYDGIWKAAFDDGVRFIIHGDTEVSQGEYATVVVIHAIALPLLLLGAGTAAVWGARRLFIKR